MAFAHDSIVPNTTSTQTKKKQVEGMFDSIAGKYDTINRFLSLGIDIGWRKKAIAQLKPINPQLILDVATGTADMALLTHKILQPQKIEGIDLSNEMLKIGREKINAQHLSQKINILQGDSEHIDFADNFFDAVTVTFGVRNFENLTQGLTEILRVLKPEGKLVILEFSKPKSKAFAKLYNWYMQKVTPNVGKLVSGNKEAYEYLNNSVQAFPEGQNFLNILHEVGFTQTYLKSLSLGICTIYCGSK